MTQFHKQTAFPVSAKALFDWHASPGAFERLMPPWEKMRIAKRQGGIKDGAILAFDILKGPLALRWRARHQGYIEDQQFQDVQEKGPFAHWVHTHKFLEHEDGTSLLDDSVEYKLPLHPISSIVAGWFMRRMLNKMFHFRHQRTMDDMTRHAEFAQHARQNVAISGGTGFIGSALRHFLTTGGHNVSLITRSPDKVDQSDGTKAIGWDPRQGKLDTASLEGIDVVINLSGESINQRWTDESKERIMKSRTEGTTLLAEAIAGMKSPPHTFISASASGYYGSRGDEVLTESSSVGDNFLAQVCGAWEEAAKPAKEAGVRVVHPRIGVVLDPSGGALEQMLTPFKMGVGGRTGSGKQWMSWITREDLVGALYFLMFKKEMSGPVNMVAPNPKTNKEFTDTLGKALGRPTVLPTPNFALKAMLGSEAAKALLLEGQRIHPTVLQDHGFKFLHPELLGAFKSML